MRTRGESAEVAPRPNIGMLPTRISVPLMQELLIIRYVRADDAGR
jgi:hypothetical protein